MFSKKLVLIFSFLSLFAKTITMEIDKFPSLIQTNIVASNIDNLVLQGIKNIRDNGELFEARAGSGQQAYDVSYTLTNPLNRVHNIRKGVARRYLCRELLAYFNGSLKVEEGLSQASSIWNSLADKNGEICSNYGYYVFHQQLPEEDKKTQYDWVIQNLVKNLDSRKAFININQVYHKKMDSKDFPCTLGMQFFVRNNYLCSAVASRSTDIYTGLPYDMGFFSFVTELVYKDLKQKLSLEKANDLKLGYVTMKTNFTQIYDKTRTAALKLFEANQNVVEYLTDMPEIYDAEETLRDIYEKTAYTPVIKWINQNAKFTS
jgi:thymidylate synthase